MRVLLAGDRPQDRDQGRKAALRNGLECAAADCVPLADLRLRLAREPAVHVVVVYLDPDPLAAVRAIKSVAAQARPPIYAATGDGAAAAREAATSAGAAGVWSLDQVREELLNVSHTLRETGAAPDHRGRIVAVTAAQPGTGVTTVASGLAFGLAGHGRVVLAELGAGVPELALDLALAPRHSLADLIRASDRMDPSMIRDTAVRHAAGVDVLAHQPETPTAGQLAPDVARDFQILLRTLYEWVVLDAGHRYGDEIDPLVLQADAVVLVTRLDPPSLRHTRLYLKALAGAGVTPESVALVVNRYGQPNQVPWRKAEEALQATVRAWLPDDPKSVNRALTDGQPLTQVAGRAKLTRELRDLAAMLGRAAPAAR
jgi:pilus assembly protein CpaE